MAAECDVETVIRRAFHEGPTVWYARQWAKKNPTTGIPCKFCDERKLPCAPRISRIHCNNSECFSSSGGCSRLIEELFSRVTAMRPALEREEFDTVLTKIRAEDAQNTPITLKIRRPPASEMAPYPSPRSNSSTAPMSDDEQDPTVQDLRQQLSEMQALILSHDEMLDQRAEKLLHVQTQIKQSLEELESTRKKLAEEQNDKTRLEEEVRQLQTKLSDSEKADVGGALLFRDLQTTISELQATTDNVQAQRAALLEENNVLQATVDILKADQKHRDAMSESREEVLRAQLSAVEADKDKISIEKHELQQQLDQAVEEHMRSSAKEQEALKTLAEKYAVLQQEKDAILARNADLEDRVRAANSISSSDKDALITRLQTELELLRGRENDKQHDDLKVQVATLQEQCETHRMEKMALVARMEDLEAVRQRERTNDEETAHLRQQLESATHQLDVYKRKLDNARKNTGAVRTSNQRTFASIHLALTRLQHDLASALGSDRLELGVKRHIRELRKLRDRVEEETPGTVDAIMGIMAVKREEEQDGEMAEDNDEDAEAGGGGGGNEEEGEERPKKRTRRDS